MEAAEHARSLIASAIREYKPQQTNTTEEERRAIRTLKKDKDVTILAADKGNATIVMDTTDYIDKANALLDNKQFKRVTRTPTNRNEKRVNETLKGLAGKGSISKDLHQKLRVPSH